MPTLLQLNCTSNWGSTGIIGEQIGMKAGVRTGKQRNKAKGLADFIKLQLRMI